MKNQVPQFQPFFSRRESDLARAEELDRKAVAMDQLASQCRTPVQTVAYAAAGKYRAEAADLRANWESSP